MGQILVYVGIAFVVIGVVMLAADSLTYKSRQKKMLDEIEKEYS